MSHSNTQLTIERTIEILKTLDPTLYCYIGGTHSYRGSYDQLGVEPLVWPQTVASFLAEMQNSLNNCFSGWRGGEYYMSSDTPVWLTKEGVSSRIPLTQTNLLASVKDSLPDFDDKHSEFKREVSSQWPQYSWSFDLTDTCYAVTKVGADEFTFSLRVDQNAKDIWRIVILNHPYASTFAEASSLSEAANELGDKVRAQERASRITRQLLHI